MEVACCIGLTFRGVFTGRGGERRQVVCRLIPFPLVSDFQCRILFC